MGVIPKHSILSYYVTSVQNSPFEPLGTMSVMVLYLKSFPHTLHEKKNVECKYLTSFSGKNNFYFTSHIILFLNIFVEALERERVSN